MKKFKNVSYTLAFLSGAITLNASATNFPFMYALPIASNFQTSNTSYANQTCPDGYAIIGYSSWYNQPFPTSLVVPPPAEVQGYFPQSILWTISPSGSTCISGNKEDPKTATPSFNTYPQKNQVVLNWRMTSGQTFTTSLNPTQFPETVVYKGTTLTFQGCIFDTTSTPAENIWCCYSTDVAECNF